MSELEFLAQALLTIGGGFRVDSKGRLIDKSIPFDNEAMQCVVPKKPFTKINYCEMDKLKEIKKLGYLDSAWVIGLGKLLDALEENKPEVLASGYGSSTVPKVIKEGKSLLKNLAKDTIPTMKP